MTAQAAAKSLLAATRRLEESVTGEVEALETALDARDRAFDAFANVLSGSELPEEARGTIVQVLEIDQRITGEIGEIFGQVRGQFEQLAQARRAAKAVRPPPEEPRFITRRV